MKLAYVLASAVALAIAACSAPDEGATVKADVASRERFELVSDAMVYQCGTLDCHGNAFRNLRLYGYGGLRLSGRPDQGAPLRVRAEVDANYDAIVGLEPESFVMVIAESGREPERLTLVAKARALQNHKGGPVMKPGDAIDDCITSWLRGNVADDRCLEATPFDPK
jgi:hypothetical protein